MGTSVVFPLINALVDHFTEALPDVEVHDGFGVSDHADDFLMVGVEDPNGSEATSADAQQTWAGLGANARNETGTVTCAALVWRGNPGDTGQREARDAAAAIVAAVENSLRGEPGEPHLGGVVPGLMWVGFGSRVRLVQDQTESGPMALVVFDIDFKARI